MEQPVLKLEFSVKLTLLPAVVLAFRRDMRLSESLSELSLSACFRFRTGFAFVTGALASPSESLVSNVGTVLAGLAGLLDVALGFEKTSMMDGCFTSMRNKQEEQTKNTFQFCSPTTMHFNHKLTTNICKKLYYCNSTSVNFLLVPFHEKIHKIQCVINHAELFLISVGCLPAAFFLDAAGFLAAGAFLGAASLVLRWTGALAAGTWSSEGAVKHHKSK